MTPTQWLAIPTEIRLTEVPKLIERPTDAVEMPAVLLNGKNVVIKQEEDMKFEVDEEGVRNNSPNLYFYPMGNGLLATSENMADVLSMNQTTDSLAATPSSPESTSAADIVIYKSKPKNPDYKVKNNILATKRSRPVSMKLVRMRPGLRVVMWMSYQGHIYGDEPVKRCKKHDECVWCNDHEFNQSFCLISKCHQYELDEKQQPRAVLKPSFEHLDQEGGVPFSVVFSCWNSCDNHSRFGKDLSFTIQIVDENEDVVKSMEFSLQCCQNLLRDAFKDRKRKQLVMAENGEEECVTKSVCVGGEGGQTPQLSPPSPPPPPPPLKPSREDKPIDIVVEGLDEERRDIIERMVHVMGGSTYRIPHLARIRALPSQKNGSIKTTNKTSKKSTIHHKTTKAGTTTCTPSVTTQPPVICNVSTTAPVASINSSAIPVSCDITSVCPVLTTTTTTSSIVSPLMSTITKSVEPPCVPKTELGKDGPKFSKEGSMLVCSKSPVTTKIFFRTTPSGTHVGLPAVTTKPTGTRVARTIPDSISFKGKSDSPQKICVKIESSWS
ncbi:hypothetical protein Pmani_011719 [Petrolisthes manimaculis]|uniref:p53 DNA-binding domain-containing protein n=1 Tax=Petrolisthes manimaculis TaxID=1843537 RepID=A0AAE1PYR1_9EUCA|nr:hypothetical protein Pmani_011719 [Petrolisthes manimaculis]